MSPEGVILAGAAAVLGVTAISGVLERLWLTEPMVITAVGLLVAWVALDDPIDLASPTSLLFLELTLALVLFSDASRIDVSQLKQGFRWPLRMLLIGLPLAILFGTAAALIALGVPLALAFLIGVVFAPTDAALAEPVLETESLPLRVRQALNIEAGVNDGLAVPALIIALGFLESGESSGSEAALVTVTQIGVGALGGLALGWIGAKVIGSGAERGWMNPLHQKIAAVALALGGFAGIQLLGGSGFVGVFVAGAVMSHLVRPRCDYLYHFADAEGHSLVLVAFFLIGAGPVYNMVRTGIGWRELLMAFLALFVARPLAIRISLLGQGLRWETSTFLGWFGPRGLATVVFLLIAYEEMAMIDEFVRNTAILTVVLSMILHGASAAPMSKWLSARLSTMDEDSPEMGDVFEFPMRRA